VLHRAARAALAAAERALAPPGLLAETFTFDGGAKRQLEERLPSARQAHA
jgi:hypothetical protein